MNCHSPIRLWYTELDRLKCFLVSTLLFYYIANGRVVYAVNYSKTFECLGFCTCFWCAFVCAIYTLRNFDAADAFHFFSIRISIFQFTHTLNGDLALSSSSLRLCIFVILDRELKKNKVCKLDRITLNFFQLFTYLYGVVRIFDWATEIVYCLGVLVFDFCAQYLLL